MTGQRLPSLRSLGRKVVENLEDAAGIGWGFPLRHLARAAGRSGFRVGLGRFGSILIRPNSSDPKVVRQVFRDREYDLAGFRQAARIRETYERIGRGGAVPLIIDAGANIGAASIWFARHFPQARILAVEPDAENAACCRANVEHLDTVEVIEAAIGSASGFTALKNETGEAWAVQTERSDDPAGVRIVTVDELVRRIPNGRLFILKVDIEGFESDLFAGNTDCPDRTHR
ncbi:MAG TPA: FkbM family methyltransferase [Stellaceae bacterium]|nr:FkbM family methyltransferase [Stellaceae bacterium]